MESIHYLLMSDHFLFQKNLLAKIKSSGLTPGQPKVLDYLKTHNGCVQKDIAAGCHIEPASAAVILKGMESKGYIERRTLGGDRRSLYVFLTEKGKEYTSKLSLEFEKLESVATKGFSSDEKELFNNLLFRMYENLYEYEEGEKKE